MAISKIQKQGQASFASDWTSQGMISGMCSVQQTQGMRIARRKAVNCNQIRKIDACLNNVSQ
jgi:hypothetical protein